VTRVKICGINSADAFDAAFAADWIGFVFFPPSPRFVTGAQAGALSERRAGGPGRVGLFVDPTDDEIASVLADIKLDVLQLHAPPERAAAIRARFAMPVWRAVGVAEAGDLPAAAGGVDALLLDAKPPAAATRPGGNAARFDWTVLSGWRPPCPWLLAGGLTPGNVAEAIAATGAGAVDVSSGVESAKGVKDPALIRAFVANARAAARTPRSP
jgi:phosphoribosylanthranilate isomerase